MPIYNRDDFDQSLIPAHLKKDSRDIIQVAVRLGWKFHRTTGTGCSLVAPGEPSPKRIHFGATRATRSTRHMMKDVIRYADPTLLYLAANRDNLPPGWSMLIPTLEEGSVDDRPQPTETRSRPVPKTEEPEPVHSVKSEESEDTKAEPHIVSEARMLAKHNANEGYYSPTTIERKWSDGSKDYACTTEGCDFTSPNRASVGAHYGKAHSRDGRARPLPATFPAVVPEATKYGPRQSRIDALAAVLASGEMSDPAEVARTALVWVHEQTKHRTQHAAETEQMTAEEALDRIRALLDQGQYRALQEQVQFAEGEVETLRERLARVESEMQAQVEAERARADRAQSNLRALSDLLNDLGHDAPEATGS